MKVLGRHLRNRQGASPEQRATSEHVHAPAMPSCGQGESCQAPLTVLATREEGGARNPCCCARLPPFACDCPICSQSLGTSASPWEAAAEDYSPLSVKPQLVHRSA